MAKASKWASLRQDVERFEIGTDARWRAEYRQAQYEKRLAGIQPDMFGGPAIEHFHRCTTRPPEAFTPQYEVQWFHDLSEQEQSALLAADPQTPFARTGRKSLSKEESAAVISAAQNWLRLGQRVRVIDAPVSLDGEPEKRVGREGVIWRLCSTAFADRVYVNFDPLMRERSEKIAFLELRDIIPIGDK
ncbi:hypothetical protein RMS29_027880 (plasmid) [Agrobacterium rosae]|uniref:Uncharacterized protein n=1 Tax=Agrobacterium rosae TaxID=1972867 RepID=A0ABU4W4B0_9HYPH|nr:MULTISPECIES: hypothetical protein [Agrobacterium]MDX8311693.1 hypothetical protein [Agrobacterium sp. rho-13.3]MDX8332628.1 hypothetical protein [Agrobacterium rosae]